MPGSLPRVGVGRPQGTNRHGLTVAQVESMRRRQHDACAICGAQLPAVPTVDHDHELARRHPHRDDVGCPLCVRALLCRDCNLMLGHARDRPETLEAGATFLRMFRALRRP